MGILGVLVAVAIVVFLALTNFKSYFKEQPQKGNVSNYTSVVSDIKSQLKTISENDPLASERN